MTPSVWFHAQKQRQNHKGPNEALRRVWDPNRVFGGKKLPLLLLFSEQSRHKLQRQPPHVQVSPWNLLAYSTQKAYPANDPWNGTSLVFIDDSENFLQVFICAVCGGTICMLTINWSFPQVWSEKTTQIKFSPQCDWKLFSIFHTYLMHFSQAWSKT
jgi:hypothetical protein